MHPHAAPFQAVLPASGAVMARAIGVVPGPLRPADSARRGGWLVVTMLLGLLASLPAMAQRGEGSRPGADGMYSAEVQVNSQAEGERRSGFARELGGGLGTRWGERGPAVAPGGR